MPLIVAQIVDRTLQHEGAGHLLSWCSIFAAVAVLSTLSRESATAAFDYATQRTSLRLRDTLLDHLQRLPIRELDRRPSGGLAALFMADVPKVASFFQPLAHDLVTSGLQLITVLLVVSWKYGSTIFLMLLLVPVYLAVPALLRRPARRAALRVAEAEADVHAEVKESLDLIWDIKAFNREGWNRSRLAATFRKVLDRKVWSSLVTSLYGVDHAAYGITVALLYWVGGRAVLAGRMSVGDLVALVWFLTLVSSPIAGLNRVQSQLQTFHASAARIASILELPTEPVEPRTPTFQPRSAMALELQDVSFRYDGRSEGALDAVSCRIEAGERVAVVGPSGAGKSTLVQLILRLREPDAGRILVDGRDLRDDGIERLRQRIGVVFQEPRLFSVSLRENILLGNLQATDEEIWEAARIANVDELISGLPEGLDTIPGEAGAGLSVGQKQRIAIARALVRNPRLLILDEATSALDSESESRVREAIGRAMKDRTVIVVAHRLNWVARCDRILVLDGGKLVAEGHHEELLRRSPLYERLVQQYVGVQGLSAAGDGPPAETRQPLRPRAL